MNKTIFTILLCLITLNACTTIKEGLTGTKKGGTDEFLVDKKAPLVVPPNFEELPEPGIKKDENLASIKIDNSSIEKIINESSSIDTSEKNNNSNNSIEESIIEKLNKKKIQKVGLDENLKETIEEKTETLTKKGFFRSLKKKFKKLEH